MYKRWTFNVGFIILALLIETCQNLLPLIKLLFQKNVFSVFSAFNQQMSNDGSRHIPYMAYFARELASIDFNTVSK